MQLFLDAPRFMCALLQFYITEQPRFLQMSDSLHWPPSISTQFDSHRFRNYSIIWKSCKWAVMWGPHGIFLYAQNDFYCLIGPLLCECESCCCLQQVSLSQRRSLWWSVPHCWWHANLFETATFTDASCVLVTAPLFDLLHCPHDLASCSSYLLVCILQGF